MPDAHTTIVLQAGKPTDTHAIAYADLAIMAAGSLFADLLGPQQHAVLMHLYKLPNTHYSSDKAIFLLEDDELAGMVSGFTQAQQATQDAASTRALLQRLGWGSWRPVLTSLWLQVRGVRFAELQSGDYYIQTIAIYPQHRGKGYSRRLLDAAVERARALQCQRVVLDVDTQNSVAIAAYEKYGFIPTHHSPARKPRIQQMSLTL